MTTVFRCECWYKVALLIHSITVTGSYEFVQEKTWVSCLSTCDFQAPADGSFRILINQNGGLKHGWENKMLSFCYYSLVVSCCSQWVFMVESWNRHPSAQLIGGLIPPKDWPNWHSETQSHPYCFLSTLWQSHMAMKNDHVYIDIYWHMLTKKVNHLQIDHFPWQAAKLPPHVWCLSVGFFSPRPHPLGQVLGAIGSNGINIIKIERCWALEKPLNHWNS